MADAEAARLRAELAAARGASAEALKSVGDALASRVALTQETYGATEAAQREALMKVQADYRAACDAHGEAEAALRKRVVRARLERDTAQKEYEATTGALREKLAAAQQLGEERAALADYEQYYARVDAERAKLEREEASVAREKLVNVALRDWVLAHRCRKFLKPWVAKVRAKVAAEKKAAKAKKK